MSLLLYESPKCKSPYWNYQLDISECHNKYYTTLWFPQTTKYYPVIIPLTWLLFSLPSARPRKRLPISSDNGGCNQPEEQIANQLLENDLLSPLQKEAKWNGISPYLDSMIRDESIPTQITKHTWYSVSNVFAALNLDEDNFLGWFDCFYNGLTSTKMYCSLTCHSVISTYEHL